MDFRFTPEQEGLYTLQQHPVVRLRRHARARQLYAGTSQIQRLVIARRLLDEHASA
jgi:alkylation response protein AidB-like acyl-CoA dehydrogenase